LTTFSSSASVIPIKSFGVATDARGYITSWSIALSNPVAGVNGSVWPSLDTSRDPSDEQDFSSNAGFTSHAAVLLSPGTWVGGPTCPLITIAPSAGPGGILGVAYAQQIEASGGTGPYIFAVSNGTLPAGLALPPTGLLSGTPTAAGSSTVAIQATDGVGCPGVITYTIIIAAAVPTLPWAFVLLLALGLGGIGYVRLRQRARTE
jgi:hypothetical protein